MEKNVRIDVNTYLNGVYDDNNSGLVRFDVYIDGTRVDQQVRDYATYHLEGTTYEITNITYDTNLYNMTITNPSGTISGDTNYHGVYIYLTDKT